MNINFRDKLRLAAVAGQFYPEGKKELKQAIEKFLSRVKLLDIEGEIFGLLLPHASYDFSGQVSAYGFKTLLGRKFDTVIILGDSHYERFDGVSVWSKGSWQIPFGEIKIDEDLAEKILAASKRFIKRDSPHLWEHSLEVQLPFLQKVLKNFKILPIIFGSENKDWCKLAEIILQNINNKKVLIIASSDLSHYLSFGKAKMADQKTLKAILNLKQQNLKVCAPDSVKTLLAISRKLGAMSKLLQYTAKPINASKTQFVGYGAAVFYR